MKRILISVFLFFISTMVLAGLPTKNLVFFGDSLTDDGNCYAVFKIVPKSPPYYKGRFSNGITWAEHLNKYSYDKSLTGYINFSVGGAETIRHSFKTDKFISPMLLEIEVHKYLKSEDAKNLDNTLFFVWNGPNDYLHEREPNKDKVTTDVINKMTESFVKLLDAGAMHIVILNLPDLSRIPYARKNDIVDELALSVKLHNKKLKDTVDTLQNKHPNKITFIDIETIFNDLLDNPKKYNDKYGSNITDVTSPCWEGSIVGTEKKPPIDQIIAEIDAINKFNNNFDLDANLLSQAIIGSPVLSESYNLSKQFDEGLTPCDNPSEHIFWDKTHPSAAVHEVLGKILIDLLAEKNLV